jgi:hypothetical protein
MSFNTRDIVSSKGRIKTLQEDRSRYISFDEGIVVDIGEIGISVNPLGMRAIVICQPDDIAPIQAPGEEPAPPLVQTPASVASGELQAESAKPLPHPTPTPDEPIPEPEGTIAVEGEVTVEEAKPAPAKAKPKDKGIAASRRRRRS